MHGNRTRLRQELEKQRQELDRRREENHSRVQREMAVSQQSASMDVPTGSSPNQVTIEVPTNILEVRKGCGCGCGLLDLFFLCVDKDTLK